MRVIAHRGLPEGFEGPGSNTIPDYERAMARGLDVEMDVRFHGKQVWCSHDPMDLNDECEPLDPTPMFGEFCDLLSRFKDVRAFVNVKCDGMTAYLREIALKYEVLDRIVTFDHSMPDFLAAERDCPDVPRARRAGCFEGAIGVASRNAPWVWLDPIAVGPAGVGSFLVRRIKRYFKMNEQVRVVVVSPEIHLKTEKEIGAVNLPGLAWELAHLPGVYGVLTDRPSFYGFRA